MKLTTIVACILLGICPSLGAVPVKRQLGLVDAFETRRLMSDGDFNAVFLSPDGRRYAVMLNYGDVARNGIWMELLVGELTSLEAAQPKSVARLFTSGLGGNEVGAGDSTSLVLPPFNPPRWSDDRHVVFFWQDNRSVQQLVSVDVESGRVDYLTRESADVVNYGAGPKTTLIYGARAASLEDSRRRSQEVMQRGFAIESLDASALVLGILDGSTLQNLTDDYQRFLMTGKDRNVRPLAVTGGGINKRRSHFQPVFAPDGKWALIDGSPSKIPAAWNGYTEPHFRRMLSDLVHNPGGGYSNQFLVPFVVDVERATARPLWDAPMKGGRFTVAVPSPDGRSILLGPTFLPPGTDDRDGLAGSAIVEVEISTGRFRKLPIVGDTRAVQRARWLTVRQIEMSLAGGETMSFEKIGDRWHAAPPSQTAGTSAATAGFPVKVELRQGLNDPPALYAVDTVIGHEALILDLNPHLRKEFDLARVAMIEWGDPDGRRWKGRFYYPVDYVAGRRYPLVVQTHGMAAEDQFSLYGTAAAYGALGPAGAIHLAQPLAARSIAVLQIPDRSGLPGNGFESPDEARFYMRHYEAAIDSLVSAGIVDRNRVGLMGHSRTGWHVEYAISHSDFPYAAAIASDNMDGNYQQAVLGGSDTVNGAKPFGEGLKDWLMHSPAFNVQSIRTPLQLQVMSAQSGLAEPVFLHWEMFRRLRYLEKPVELYVMANLLRGAHAVQNPQQLLPLQERTLDWWRFWLKGEEDPEVSKAQQYASWRKLKEQYDADLEKPLAPRFTWSATSAPIAAGSPAPPGSVSGRWGWLEDSHDPRTAAWIESQNDRTLQQLGNGLQYTRIYQSALTIHQDQGRMIGDWRGSDMLHGDRLYNLRQDKTNARGLWRSTHVKDFMQGSPRWTRLLDLDVLSKEEEKPLVYTMNSSFTFPAAQCLGRRCMVGIGNGSERLASYREFDVESGDFVKDGFVLPESRMSTAVWRDEDALVILAPPATAGEMSVVKEWRRGQPLSAARELLRADLELPSIRIQGLPTAEGSREIVLMQGGLERRVFWRLDGQGHLRRMNLPDGVELIGLHRGHWIFQLVLGDRKIGGRLWKENSVLSIPEPDIESSQPRVWVVMVPKDRQYIHGVKIARGAVLITSFDNVVGRAWKLDLVQGNWQSERLPLPDNGAVYVSLSHPEAEVAFVSFESFLQPPTLYAVNVVNNAVLQVGAAHAAFEGSRYTIRQLEAKSRDGTWIPYFLVVPNGFIPNRSAPTLLHAYGGAGPEWPEYSPALGKLWLEEGGIYAFASIRGGGDLGKPWRLWGAEREKTYEDFIAVAEDLIARNITSPERLGIRGHSNGGLLVGVMLNLRPDLFNAAIMENPVLDQLDMRFPFYIGPASEETLAFVNRTSPLQNLRPLPSFPVPLVTTNTNDTAVLPYWARKYVAKLQDLGVPCMFHELPEGNHKIHGSTPEQGALHDAVVFSYLARRLMLPGQIHR